MAAQRRFHNVRFARMKDLLEMDLPDDMREITYVANCTNFRHLLMTKFGRHDLDIDQEIATNSDIKLTYLGYKRFLESDLKFVYPQGPDRTSNDYRRDCKYLAKQMLIRGYVSRRRESPRGSHLPILGHQLTVDDRHLREQSRMHSPIICGFPSTNP